MPHYAIQEGVPAFVGQQGSGESPRVALQTDTAVKAPPQVMYPISPSWASVDVVLFSYRISRLSQFFFKFLDDAMRPRHSTSQKHSGHESLPQVIVLFASR